MAQNPPNYFPPNYFDAGYWGGEQVEGAMSATLSGGGAINATISFTQTQVETSGGRKRRSNYAYLDAKPVQTKPVFIEAKLGGAAAFTGAIIASADMQAGLVGKSGIETNASAAAAMESNLLGASALVAAGDTVKIVITVDRWAKARQEDEFWLLAA